MHVDKSLRISLLVSYQGVHVTFKVRKEIQMQSSSNAANVHAALVSLPRLWNDLPPELRTISSPPPSSLPITRHHLHPPPLSPLPVTPRAFPSKLKSHLFKHSYPDPSDHSPPHLNNTHPNSYTVPSWYSGNRT